jgi:hypothetical protein
MSFDTRSQHARPAGSCTPSTPECPRFPQGAFLPEHSASSADAGNRGPQGRVSRSGPRRRRAGIVPVAFVLLVSALVAVVWTTGLPSLWWPQIGNVFSVSSQQTAKRVTTTEHHGDSCALVVGPAADYCHDAASSEASTRPHRVDAATQRVATAALGVGAVAAGVGALVVLRRRA